MPSAHRVVGSRLSAKAIASLLGTFVALAVVNPLGIFLVCGPLCDETYIRAMDAHARLRILVPCPTNPRFG